MIGYYIHHVGRGHLHRALSIAKHLPCPPTGISSLPRPSSWPGPWLQLARDDVGRAPSDPTAGGLLHWAPRHDVGLQRRLAQLTEWIARCRPDALVVDLSVEVVVQARLAGVPVVAIALPGSRPDRAHQLGYELADAIVAPWPVACASIGPDLQAHLGRVTFTGAISRYADRARVSPVEAEETREKRALILNGSGSGHRSRFPGLPGWTTTMVGGDAWTEDPWPLISRADLVVTHAGLGALADVATAGRPAIVIPQSRPHDEQVHTGRGLDAGAITIVAADQPSPSIWSELVVAAEDLGGEGWQRWLAGTGAAGAAEVIRTVAGAGSMSACR